MNNNSKIYEVLSSIISSQTEMAQILSSKYYNIEAITGLLSGYDEQLSSFTMSQEDINNCYQKISQLESSI